MIITGTLKSINPVVEKISAKFSKVVFILTDNTNPQSPQHLPIELQNSKIGIISQFQAGDIVRVSLDMRGREWKSRDGSVKYILSLVATQIEKADNGIF